MRLFKTFLLLLGFSTFNPRGFSRALKTLYLSFVSITQKPYRFLRALTILFCFIAFPVMGQEAMRLSVDSTPLIIQTASGKTRFDVEIANSPQELSRGLMFRTDFPKNRAMLFVFGKTYIPSMWMKNTPLPLDMLFVDEQGKIVSIATNTEPFSERVISSSAPAAYVIEINAGEVQARDIKEGDSIKHPIFH